MDDRYFGGIRRISAASREVKVVDLSRRILLVEDEPAIRQLMAAALERAGYYVVQARNGREALALYDDGVDLVVTDMRMPHMPGLALIEELRLRRRSVKVLAISGYTGGTDMDATLPFLAKPFSRDDLITAVRNVLEA